MINYLPSKTAFILALPFWFVFVLVWRLLNLPMAFAGMGFMIGSSGLGLGLACRLFVQDEPRI